MPTGTLKALVIDDSPTDQMVLSQLLTDKLGWTVETADDGMAGLDRLSSHSFDMVFLDLTMPVMSGVEVLSEIRGWSETAALPVIIISGNTDRQTVKSLLDLKISDYVIKPFTGDTLIKRLEPTLNKFNKSATAPNSLSLPGENVMMAANKPIALVADGDVNFRHFFTTAAADRFNIVEAANGAKALAAAVEYQPAYVFLGAQLGPFDGRRLAAKLRAQETKAAMKIYAIGGEAQGDKSFDGSLRRTFVEADFIHALDKLIPGLGPKTAGGKGAGAGNLAAELRSAVEQVFGMMMAIEVFVLETPPRTMAAPISARLDMTSETEQRKIALTLRCDRAVAERIAQRLLKEEFDNSWELISSSLSEVLNIVAGRLINSLSARGKLYSVGIPVVSEQAEDPIGGAERLAFHAGDDIEFVVGLDRIPLGQS